MGTLFLFISRADVNANAKPREFHVLFLSRTTSTLTLTRGILFLISFYRADVNANANPRDFYFSFLARADVNANANPWEFYFLFISGADVR